MVLRFKTITPDLRPKKLKIKVLTEPSYYAFLLHGRAIVIVYDVGKDDACYLVDHCFHYFFFNLIFIAFMCDVIT